MTTATATLVHTSSREADNAVRVARVAADGRVAAERRAVEARKAAVRAHATRVATAWADAVLAEGATFVGFKVCDDYGKHRFIVAAEDAAGVLVNHWGEDVEAWGILPGGEYVANVW